MGRSLLNALNNLGVVDQARAPALGITRMQDILAGDLPCSHQSFPC